MTRQPDPAPDPHTVGDLWWDTTTATMRIYRGGGVWEPVKRQPDPAPEVDLDAIWDRVTWVMAAGLKGDNARRLVAEDVPALLALARRLLAERDALAARFAGLEIGWETGCCGICWTSSWVPCPADHPDAHTDEGGSYLCQYCGMAEAHRAVVAERDELRAVLRPILDSPWITGHDGGALCRVCGQDAERGHEDGCPVLDRARLLGDEGGTG